MAVRAKRKIPEESRARPAPANPSSIPVKGRVGSVVEDSLNEVVDVSLEVVVDGVVVEVEVSEVVVDPSELDVVLGAVVVVVSSSVVVVDPPVVDVVSWVVVVDVVLHTMM